MTEALESQSIAMDLRRGAKRVGLGLTRFRQEADAGRVKTFYCGRRRLVSEQALADFVRLLESERTAPSQPAETFGDPPGQLGSFDSDSRFGTGTDR
jgi:hypothetical protein